jgi:hypothetical protein
MNRLRDLGDAHVIGEAETAVAVRAAVLIAESATGRIWAGELRPYRPLALTAGRFVLRVRGEDLGVLYVQAVHTRHDREIGDFIGEGEPSAALLQLAARGGSPRAARQPRFPQVAGAVETTALGHVLGAISHTALRLATVPVRLVSRRRRVGMVAHGRR